MYPSSDQPSAFAGTAELIERALSTVTVAPDDIPDDADAHDPAVLASKAGYTGTLTGFIDWLTDAVTYGSVVLDTAVVTNPQGVDHVVLRTTTGGWSNDEHLLARVQSSVLGGAWESSHRGGLTIYQIPPSWFEQAAEITWLTPETDLLDTFGFVRQLHVYDEERRLVTSLAVDDGVELHLDGTVLAIHPGVAGQS